MKKLLIGLLASFVVAGCQSGKKDIVGTWEIVGAPADATIQFKSDGTFESSFAGQTQSGPYAMEGDNFTMMSNTGKIIWNDANEVYLSGDGGAANMTLRRRS